MICTMPGRFGDLLWALPTCRALATVDGPVDLVVSGKYGALAPLLRRQAYLRQVIVDDTWIVQETAPMTPAIPPSYPAADVQLGYVGWPGPTLAADIYTRAQRVVPAIGPLDLTTPWIVPEPLAPASPRAAKSPWVWIGWSDEWIELKAGITLALASRFPEVDFCWISPHGSRAQELRPTVDNLTLVATNWDLTAALAASATCYLGCLSAQWVLANALGIPAVVVEPSEARWHPVFWQDGGGRNRLVRGTDGRPTFDARHVGDVLGEVLRCG